MGIKYLLLSVLSLMMLSLFFSCEKDDNKHKSPTIEILPLNDTSSKLSLVNGDTLYIYTNQDTIFNRIRARFAGDNELSSYNMRIKALKADATDIINDTVTSDTIRLANDTITYAYWLKSYQSQKISGETSKTIIQSIRLDSIFTPRNMTKKYPTWMQGPYQFKISLVDRYGNESVEYFKIYMAKKAYVPAK